MLSSDDWVKLIEIVQKQSGKILENSEYHGLVFDDGVPDIDLFVNDLNHEKTAKCKKLGDKKYQIEIAVGLIDSISNDSAGFIFRNRSIFHGIERGKDNEKLKYANLWMTLHCVDYVFHHELAHIHRGHLALLSTPGWFEDIVRPRIPQRTDLDEFEIRQYLEAEADSFAAISVWGRLVFFFRKIGSTTYGEVNASQILLDYMYSIFFLINWQQPTTQKLKVLGHPPRIFRALIFQEYLIISYEQALSQLHKLDEDEKALFGATGDQFREFVKRVFVQFHVEQHGMSPYVLARLHMQCAKFVAEARIVLSAIGL